MKKLLALAVAMIMVLAMSTAVFAQTPTGSVTVHNPVYGHTYTGYKIFDATYNGTNVSYTIDSTNQFYADVVASNLFTLTQVGNTTTYTVAKAAGVTDAQIIAWLQGLNLANKTADLPAITASAATPTVAWSPVPFGYYLIAESDGTNTGISVDTANPAAVIYDKITTPGFTGNGKEVWDSTEQTWGETSQAQVGDTVHFRITAVLPEYNNGVEVHTYTFVDTLAAGITYDPNSLRITWGGTEYTLATLPSYFNVTVGTDNAGNTVITITMAADQCEPYPGNPAITIYYEGTVNTDADIHNKNTVTLDWDGTTTPPEETDTTTAGFEVIKTNGTTQIEGAKFTLWDAATNGNRIYVTYEGTDANGYKIYKVTTTPNSIEIEAGKVRIIGLDSDRTYYLEETQAPAGYNPLTARFAIHPAFTEATNEGVTTVTYPTDNVVNNTGSELPETGGIGTTIFYVIGGLMMAAAVVLLATRKKMSVED